MQGALVLIIFVGIVIGFYIVSTIYVFISHFSGINLSFTKNVKKSTLHIIGKKVVGELKQE